MQTITPDVDRAILDLIDSFPSMGAYLAPGQEPPMRTAMRSLVSAILIYGDARAAAERERCAKVAAASPGGYEVARVAAAIRKLS